MPTNIIDGRADAVGPSTFSTVGSGLGQIGQLLAATWGAKNANDAAKRAAEAGKPVPIPGAIDPDTMDLGPSAMPGAMPAGILGAGSGNLGTSPSVAALPSARDIPGMSLPVGTINVGPSTAPPDLMRSLQFGPATGGTVDNRFAYRLQSPIQSLMTRNFTPSGPSTYQYGGL